MTRFIAAFLAVLALVLLPLFVAGIPPLHDYPFHLARSDILASMPHSAFLRAHYELGSFLLPNVGLDVVMLPLTGLLPILVAGRVLLGMVLVIMLTGTVALHAALHRRLSAWPLLAGLFLYNWMFLYGFLNYLLGVGLMLWATAGWVVLRERAIVWRLIWATLMAVVLLFCHLVSLGLFAVVVAGMELRLALRTLRADRLGTLRTLALSAAPFVIALAVFVALSPASGEAGERLAYHGGLGWKPLVAYRSLLTTLGWPDIALLAPIAVGVLVALWWRRLRLAFPMGLPLVLLVATFLVMPFYIFGSESGDSRLPIAILLVAIASTSVVGLSRRSWWLLGLGAFALMGTRTALLTQDWIAANRHIAPVVEAFRQIPDGATLYVATANRSPSIDYRDAAGLALWHPPMKHVVSLASLGRDIFVPSTWSDPNKQPMRLAAMLAPVKEFQGNDPIKTVTAPELDAVVRQIGAFRTRLSVQPGSPPDYLLLLYPDLLQGALPAGSAPVARGSDFVLLRLPG